MISEADNIDQTDGNNDSFNSMNNESWYSDFVAPVMNKLDKDENCRMVKLGPINISKTMHYGYKYFHLGTPLPLTAD